MVVHPVPWLSYLCLASGMALVGSYVGLSKILVLVLPKSPATDHVLDARRLALRRPARAARPPARPVRSTARRERPWARHHTYAAIRNALSRAVTTGKSMSVCATSFT